MIAQYDVSLNPSVRSRDSIPYFVDIQSDFLSGMRTRLVIPLSRVGAGGDALPKRLIPSFNIDGERLSLHAHQTSAVEARSLKTPVATLSAFAGKIRDALDAVVRGI